MSIEEVFNKMEEDIRVDRQHGLPGKTLVHEGVQFYCTGCGSKMNEVLLDRKLIICPNIHCTKGGWRLLRPDLRSCEVMDKGESK